VRRVLVPVILALVAVSSAVAAVRAVPPATAEGEAGARVALAPAPEAPVLTPRRLGGGG